MSLKNSSFPFPGYGRICVGRRRSGAQCPISPLRRRIPCPFSFRAQQSSPYTIWDTSISPKRIRGSQRAYLDLTTRYSQRRATLVLADSAATADDMSRFYETPADKIRVVYPGVDGARLSAYRQSIALPLRERYQLPARYFIFIGTLQPRKNIKRLVERFRSYGSESMTLLARQRWCWLAPEGWLFDESWLNGASNVIVTGYIDEADKDSLLAGAIALVFPSLYEGFGFPGSGSDAYAVRLSSPAIHPACPNWSATRACWLIPLNASEIAQAMSRCSEDEDLRQMLIARGRQRAKRFTWSAAAETVMDGLRRAGPAR